MVTKPYVRKQQDFCSISHVKLWLQTLCALPMRVLWYFACGSLVTKPMFVSSPISVVFRMYISGHKPYVRSQYDFCCNSYVNQRLEIRCSFPIRFLHDFPIRLLQYFVCKYVVINPMFVPNPISKVFRM